MGRICVQPKLTIVLKINTAVKPNSRDLVGTNSATKTQKKVGITKAPAKT